ncbi:hypothetical protein AQI95_21265 [Streptomyces yokosukanensis]|uniref:Uncharacterized protein n=1 Tax=Streptomyces yokosukanensis TaxID=67386 RepID=A0A117Q1L7_9ACTN|nr:hypothetical protein [Streptomyces yokosukanensis]KUN03971.1 hypothetical protein AQI95_21265 [Streptomyces yokosukanensis]
MNSRRPVRRPTEHAAVRAAARSARPTPPVPALMAALLEANDRGDREAVTLCAHRVVRASDPKVGEQ